MKKRASARYRVEKDYLGKKRVPARAYYGIATERAIENFPISGITLQRELVHALAVIKKAAARANLSEKSLDLRKAKSIMKACDEIIKGKLDSEFPIDVYQAGAGTSEHMNINEVIANRALEIMGKRKGQYDVISPHDDVNLGQSTNDVFHSAIHVAAFSGIREKLLPAVKNLEKAFEKKSISWRKVVKTGRTHMRDAVPMTLGQEFSGYTERIRKDYRNIEQAADRLKEINIGGSAVGTGVNAGKGFGKHLLKYLNRETGYSFRQSKNLFEGTQSLSAIAVVSSALKVFASTLIQIARDIRLLSSGPVSGLNELTLQAVQPGSSIMPGKINPSILEMIEMIAFQVVGNDETITLANQEGELELNVMMPLSAYDLLHSIEILSNGVEVLRSKCIEGIKPNTEVCRLYVEKNPILATLLTPYIGYDKAAHIAQRAYKENKSVKEIVIKEKILDRKVIDKIFTLQGFGVKK